MRNFSIIILFFFISYLVIILFYKSNQQVTKMFAAPTPTLIPLEEAQKAMQDFRASNTSSPPTSTNQIIEKQEIIDAIYKRGNLQGLEKSTSGQVLIGEIQNTTFAMLFDDFTTIPGPDLHIFLSKSIKPMREDIYYSLDIGALENYSGKQFFIIPANTDLSQYNSLIIMSKKYALPWAYAPFNTQY